MVMDFNRIFRTVLIFATKVWTFIIIMLRKQARTVLQHQTIRYDELPLSPISRHRLDMVGKKTLVLDLDETLVHSHQDGVSRAFTDRPNNPPDFTLRVFIDGRRVKFLVHKRPHVDFFLDVISKWYNLVVFTASMEIYGNAVANFLDNNRGILTRRYFRQDCEYVSGGGYTKNLKAVEKDLARVFILDNSPAAYRANLNNAIPINSWFSDAHDTSLLNLLPVLDALRFCSDVRSVLSRNLHLHNLR